MRGRSGPASHRPSPSHCGTRLSWACIGSPRRIPRRLRSADFFEHPSTGLGEENQDGDACEVLKVVRDEKALPPSEPEVRAHHGHQVLLEKDRDRGQRKGEYDERRERGKVAHSGRPSAPCRSDCQRDRERRRRGLGEQRAREKRQRDGVGRVPPAARKAQIRERRPKIEESRQDVFPLGRPRHRLHVRGVDREERQGDERTRAECGHERRVQPAVAGSTRGV